jgi:hypothetical protein
MNTNLKNFVAGGAGVLAFEIALFARHPEAITHHVDRFGATGVVVAASTLILLAAFTGLMMMALRPRTMVTAFLGGVVPPAILLAAALPKYGSDQKVTPSGRVLIIKPKPAEALWLPVSPSRHIVDGTTASIRSREARVVAEAVAAAEERAQEYEQIALAAAVKRAKREAQERHEAAVAELQRKLRADRAEAFAALQQEHTAHLATLTAEVKQERAAARTAVEAQRAAEHTLAKERSAMIAARAGGADALRVEVSQLRGELELAADRRREIAREREDYRRLVEWYFTDVPATGDRPFKILSQRLASRDRGDRVVAARLMVLCGPSAKPILRRALADTDTEVRETVETSLAVLDK